MRAFDGVRITNDDDIDDDEQDVDVDDADNGDDDDADDDADDDFNEIDGDVRRGSAASNFSVLFGLYRFLRLGELESRNDLRD